MNSKISLKTISIKDLWNVFRGCCLFVIAAAVLVTGAMYAYAKITYVPNYSSTATVYLIDKSEAKEEDVSDSEFNVNKFAMDYTIALKVIPDVKFILTSPKVIDQVSKDVGFYVNSGNITLVNPDETRVLKITATSSTPEKAKAIVDSVCKVGAKEIEDMIQYNRMYIYEEGTLNSWPSNTVTVMGYAKFGIIAAILVYLVFLAMFLFDNYIHTEEDIERYLGLSVLGDIPDADAPKKKNKYTRYKSYKRRDDKYYAASSGKKE